MLGHGMLEVDVAVARAGFEVEAAFSVVPGKGLAILGPSGAGKTTVLESVAGLATPCRGTVRLASRTLFAAGSCDVEVSKRRVGLVRQRPALFPHLTVEKNIFYSARQAPLERTRAVIDRLGLTALMSRRPSELSGGQAHRVAIARVLAAECEALLLDEPFDGLDRDLRSELMTLVASMAAELALPMVVVTHTLEDVVGMVDRVLVLTDGRVVQQGEIETVLRRPASRTVARLLGYRAFARLVDAPSLCAAVHPDDIVARDGAGPEAVMAWGRVVTRMQADWPRRVRVAFEEGAVDVVSRNVYGVGSDVVVWLVDPPLFRGEELSIAGEQRGERAQR